MRWLFLLVLGFNIVYILTQVNDPANGSAGMVATPKDVDTIVLLKEVQLDEVSSKRVAGSEMHVAGSEKVELSASAEKSAVEAGGVPKYESGQSSPPDPDQMTTGSSERLQDDGENQLVPKSLSQSVQQDELSGTGGLCFTYGPFRKLDLLLELKREIEPYVTDIEYRSREEKARSSYWVYIKPLKDRKSAKALAKQLRSKKIKDFYIVRSGENINAISLGHFKSKRRAYDLTDKVKKQGFDVTVEPRFKSYTLYWLDYQLAEKAVIPESVHKAYAKKSTQENFSRLDRKCD